MTTRKDIHSPLNYDGSDYRFEGLVYLGQNEEASEIYLGDQYDASDIIAGGKNWQDGNFSNKGTCDHCGAFFVYGCVFEHEPTGEYIVIGHQCASERFSCEGESKSFGHAESCKITETKTNNYTGDSYNHSHPTEVTESAEIEFDASVYSDTDRWTRDRLPESIFNESFTVSLDPDYVLPALTIWPMRIWFDTPETPIRFQPVGVTSASYIVMPKKISDDVKRQLDEM